MAFSIWEKKPSCPEYNISKVIDGSLNLLQLHTDSTTQKFIVMDHVIWLNSKPVIFHKASTLDIFLFFLHVNECKIS